MSALMSFHKHRLFRSTFVTMGVCIVVIPLVIGTMTGRGAAAAQSTSTVEASLRGPRPGLGRMGERCQRRIAIGVVARHRLDEHLANLVEENVLTEEQAAAVRDEILGGPAPLPGDATSEATDGATPIASESDRRVGADRARPCARMARFGAWLDDVSDIIGLDRHEVLTRYIAGESLAEIGASQGVSRDDLIVGLTTALGERLDLAEESGRLSAEKRAEIEANLNERLEMLIDRRHGDPAPRADDKATPLAAIDAV